jgi:type IV pilus assembly protein PilB
VLKLGDILVRAGDITPAQLRLALDEQQRNGKSLGRVLVDLQVLSEDELVAALATQIGLRFVDLSEYAIDGNAVRLVPAQVCRRHHALPVGYEDGKLLVAMADPANVFALDDIRSATRMDVKPMVATKADVMAAIDRFHRGDDEMDELASGFPRGDRSDDLASMTEVVEDAPIVKFVNILITQAVQDRASDIHIEPAEKDLRVRFRIDGVLHEVMRSPKSMTAGVTSRLKIMADINIAERRIPQDGRLSTTVNGKKVDLRVATLPTVWGEKIVMRILDNSSALMKLSDLGFGQDNYDVYEKSFVKPYGMILVTGPTGSGKSTTLYATLNIVSNPKVNVITVEDPVEYRLEGINQVQTNAKAGLTFAAALRSILRSDPDVVLLGEIRDRETAHIAVEAALTGHLVLSTLHTNDAPSAIVRLTEMGIEPFLVGSALDCVLAQRLARKLCTRCREAYVPTREALADMRMPLPADEPVPTLFRPVGCSACAKTGYRGPHRPARGDGGERGHRAVDRRAGLDDEHRPDGAGAGHGHAPRGRPVEGQGRPHLHGGDPARRGLTSRDPRQRPMPAADAAHRTARR